MAGVSRRYGRALYNLAKERGTLDVCLGQAAIVRETLDSPECRSVLQHPHISREEKHAFIQSVFSHGLEEPLQDFLLLLITRGRAAIVSDALAEFIELGMHWRGEVEAYVVSAVPLREEQVSALREALVKKTGKQVEMIPEVDPALIGGFCIAVDGHCIDRSVKKRLEDMRNSIEKGEGFDGTQTR